MSDEDLQEVDRVLRTFARVQAPVGMQERLRQRLQQAEAEQLRKARVVWKGGLIPATAVFVAITIGVSGWLHGHERKGTAVRPQPVAVLRSLPQVPRGSAPPLVFEARAPLPAGRGAFRASTVSRPHRRELLNEVAASFPAPPAPLTEQEKLLLRLAQRQTTPTVGPNKPLLNADTHSLAGVPLPKFSSGSTPGESLPPFDVATAPGHPLPPFTQARPTGDPQ